MVCDNFVKGEPFIKQSKCNRFVSKLSQSKPALSSKATCCVTMVATKFTQWICDAFNCAQPRLHMSWSSFLSINLSVEYMACPHYKIPRTLVLTRFRVGSSRHASNSPQSSVTTHQPHDSLLEIRDMPLPVWVAKEPKWLHWNQPHQSRKCGKSQDMSS